MTILVRGRDRKQNWKKKSPHLLPVKVTTRSPALAPPRVNPVVDFGPKSPLPKPPEEADVVAGVAVLPRVPKLSPTEGLLVIKNTK